MNPVLKTQIEKRPSAFARFSLWLILFSFVAFVIWAKFTRVPNVVRADLTVEPSGEVQRIQHPDGGTLAELLVSSGDRVTAGQVLLRVDSTRAASNLGENESRQAALRAQITRLKAEAMGEPYEPLGSELAEQRATHQARLLAVAQQQQVIDERIESLKAQEQANEVAINSAQTALASAQTEYEQFERLQSSGAVSKVEVLQLRRVVQERQATLDQLMADMPRLRAEQMALARERATIEANFRQQAQEALLQAEVELTSLERLAEGIADRVQATEILAPTDGVLGEVRVNTIGQVIRAGDVLMEIVPQQDDLAARVQVAPADIGFVTEGQPVNIRLTAYDFSQFGVLTGTVSLIGANTEQPQPDREPFYPVKVRLDEQHLFKGSQTLDLRVGMKGTADVVVGERTILEYLLTPFSKIQYEAFTE